MGKKIDLRATTRPRILPPSTHEDENNKSRKRPRITAPSQTLGDVDFFNSYPPTNALSTCRTIIRRTIIQAPVPSTSFSDFRLTVSDPVVVEPFQTHVFMNEVSYYVVQKQMDPYQVILLRSYSSYVDANAPPIVSISDDATKFIGPGSAHELRVGEEVLVCKIRSGIPGRLPSSVEKIQENYDDDGSLALEPHAVCLDVMRGRRVRGWTELAFVVLVKKPELIIVNWKYRNGERIPIALARNIESSNFVSLEPGTLVRVNFSMVEKGTVFSVKEDLAIPPECSPVFRPLRSVELLADVSRPTGLESVTHLPQDEFSQFLLASVALIEHCSRKDKKESIQASLFLWNLSQPQYAHVMYDVPQPINTSAPSHGDYAFYNYMNSLFLPDSIALLRRVKVDSTDESGCPPVHVRIKTAVYEKNRTQVSFMVDATYLMRLWNLENLEDLLNSYYVLEPSDLLSHLRTFLNKVVSDSQYIYSRLRDSATKADILRPFLPIQQITASKNVMSITEEDAADESREDGEYSTVQQQIVESVVDEERPFVLVDGGCRMGKTETAALTVPGLLTHVINYDPNHTCLALVASKVSSLSLLMDRMTARPEYKSVFGTNSNVYALNLMSFASEDKRTAQYCYESSLGHVISDILASEVDHLTKEDRTVLTAAQLCLCSKLLPYTYSEETGHEAVPNPPSATDSSSDLEDGEINDSENFFDFDDYVSRYPDTLITSTELAVLQKALIVIFRYRHPNFIIATNDTLISLLPVLQDEITHLFVEDAGLSSMIDILAMVTEIPNIRQLVLIGDSFQIPTCRRIRIDKLPTPFQSVMNAVDSTAASVTAYRLRKTFNMCQGISDIIRYAFYEDRSIEPMSTVEPVNFPMLHHPEIPVCFLEMAGKDKVVFPTTRSNWQQSEVVSYLVHTLQAENADIRIAVLCYYEGQRQHVLTTLIRHKLDLSFVEMSTVDSWYGKATDAVIVVTTRTREEIASKARYRQVFKNGRVFLQRIPYQYHEVDDIKKPESFSFVFDHQRLLTALSRGKRGCFIIGSAELLREDKRWNLILNSLKKAGHFIQEPPLPAEIVAEGRRIVLLPKQTNKLKLPPRKFITF